MYRTAGWIRLAGCLLGLAGPLGALAADSAAPAAASEASIDFQRDIWPIFQQHCLDCHGSQQEGSLRLDSRAHAALGGHTGSPLLGGDVLTNAVLLRVSTTDEAIRMPKGRLPLSAAEQELLRRWVEAGTPWIDPPPAAASVDRFELSWESLQPWDPREWSNVRYQRIMWWYMRFGWAFIAILLWIGVCERTRQWAAANHPRLQPPRGRLWRWLARTPRAAYLAALLGLGIVAAGCFYQQQARLADGEVDRLQTVIAGLEHQLHPETQRPGEVPRPTRPKHPPRLGGEYYRGNDERNPQLFNGGFYRTCTMRVWLCDSDGRILAWGDPVDPAHCTVRFEIEQAPSATDALFSPEIMQHSYVADIAPGTAVTSAARQIHPLEPDGARRWTAVVSIDLTGADAAAVSGTLYLCRGQPPQDGGTPGDVHYAAEYSIRLTDGRIAPQSELWLGCVFRTGGVMVTPEGKIPDDEWFSFRPIPEIEGGQTTSDPTLLGIDAYKDELKPSADPAAKTD